jgi:hypothetical protein
VRPTLATLNKIADSYGRLRRLQDRDIHKLKLPGLEIGKIGRIARVVQKGEREAS